MANRSRPKQIVIRASEKEIITIKEKVKQSGLTQNEFLLKSALDKPITKVEGLRDLTVELKRIGNNLNQLTRAVHEGKVNCDTELKGINKEMKDVWHLLRLLIQKQV